jgi:F0F1-type ATP synthase beta subunit
MLTVGDKSGNKRRKMEDLYAHIKENVHISCTTMCISSRSEDCGVVYVICRLLQMTM